MRQERMETVNRSSYLLNQLIPAVEHQLAGVPGVETLLRKLRNETWRHGRKEAAIFHAQRALAYHRAGKLRAIEQYVIPICNQYLTDVILSVAKNLNPL